jgi:hypothetical protein
MKTAFYFLSEAFRRLYELLVPAVLRYKALVQLPLSILERVFNPVLVHPSLSPWQAKPDRRSVIPKSPGFDYSEVYKRMKPKPGSAAL